MKNNVADISLESLGLSTRVYNALIRAGARTAADVALLSNEELSSIPWMPADGTSEVLHALMCVGLTLSGSNQCGIAHMNGARSAEGMSGESVLPPEVICAADAWIADQANANLLREIAESSGISYCYLVGKLPIAVKTLQGVDSDALSSALLDKMRWYAAELAEDEYRLQGGQN